MTEEYEDDELIEGLALERMIQVMDACELLPDSQSRDNLEAALVRVRDDKERWVQDKDSLQPLLLLETSIAEARSVRVECFENILKQLESIQLELESERLYMGDAERENNWEVLLKSILVETKRACHQKLQLLEEMDKELDETFHETEVPITDVGSTSVLSKFRSMQQKLLFSNAVQTARSLLFDLDKAQLLIHNSGCSNNSNPISAERQFSPARPLLQILTASTALEAFQTFCSHTTTKSKESKESTLTVVSITGDEGTGKSHCLDQMEAYQASLAHHVSIIRPSIPLDFLLPIIGDAENTICSIFDAGSAAKSCAILFDNVDELWNFDDESQIGDHIGNFVLSAMEMYRRSLGFGSNVMFVVCSTRETSAYGLQTDKVFHLVMPESIQRRAFLEEQLSFSGDNGDPILIDELADMTAGRSYADLMQFVRQALEPLATSCENESVARKAMLVLKAKLSKTLSPSFRGGRLDADFEATVLNEIDLALSISDHDVFPFQGNSAKQAWTSLQRTICIPFCNCRKFRDLSGADATETPQGSLLGGVLLSGPSGSGKSALATHCARVIAKTVPVVTVLFVSCTALIHKEVGSSEQSIRRLFEGARKSCPCVIIMEGIENIGATRGNDLTTEGTMDRVLSTLLVELDGADSGKSNLDGRLAIIATTIDESWVDAALKRPGRFGSAVNLSKDFEIDM